MTDDWPTLATQCRAALPLWETCMADGRPAATLDAAERYYAAPTAEHRAVLDAALAQLQAALGLVDFALPPGRPQTIGELHLLGAYAVAVGISYLAQAACTGGQLVWAGATRPLTDVLLWLNYYYSILAEQAD